MTNRFVAVAVGVALVAGPLAACSSSKNKSGGSAKTASGNTSTLIVGTDAEPTTLDPQLKDDDGKDLATWRINESLVDFDKNGKPIPDLAASLPTQTNPTTWQVKLLPNVKFTDGEPFNADTVVYNVKRILDPKYNSTFAAELTTIKTAVKVDNLTVNIITKAPDPILMYRLRTMRIVPVQASQKPGFASNPVGTGPYEFVSWDKGSSLTLKASPTWRGKKPSITKVIIKFIPDPTTRLQALQSGEIDMATHLDPSVLSQVPHPLVSENGSEVSWIRINTGKAPFNDIRVRQALNYAIDKNALSKQLFGGTAEPANCQLTPPQAGGTDPNLKPFPYDPAKAKSLLAAAGAAGAHITIQWSTGVYPSDKEFGEAVRGMLDDVGLHVTMQYLAVSQFIDSAYKAGASAVPLFFGETDNSLNNAARQVAAFYSSTPYIESALGPKDQPEANKLVDAALYAKDPQAATAAYNAFQKWQCDNSLFVYLLDHKQIWGTNSAVEYTPGNRGEFTKMYFDEVTLK